MGPDQVLLFVPTASRTPWPATPVLDAATNWLVTFRPDDSAMRAATAPPPTVAVPEPSAKLLLRVVIASPAVNPPVNVLAPLSTSVPGPFLVRVEGAVSPM